jgi:hypothetical protein
VPNRFAQPLQIALEALPVDGKLVHG